MSTLSQRPDSGRDPDPGGAARPVGISGFYILIALVLLGMIAVAVSFARM